MYVCTSATVQSLESGLCLLPIHSRIRLTDNLHCPSSPPIPPSSISQFPCSAACRSVGLQICRGFSTKYHDVCILLRMVCQAATASPTFGLIAERQPQIPHAAAAASCLRGSVEHGALVQHVHRLFVRPFIHIYV